MSMIVMQADDAYTLRMKINGEYLYYMAQRIWTPLAGRATVIFDHDAAVQELQAVRALYPDLGGTDYQVVTVHGALTTSPA